MSRSKTATPALPLTSQKLVEQLIAGYQTPADIIGENGLLKQITKAIFEAALKAEMTTHLGHERHGTVGNVSGNVRNGNAGVKSFNIANTPNSAPTLDVEVALTIQHLKSNPHW